MSDVAAISVEIGPSMGGAWLEVLEIMFCFLNNGPLIALQRFAVYFLPLSLILQCAEPYCMSQSHIPPNFCYACPRRALAGPIEEELERSVIRADVRPSITYHHGSSFFVIIVVMVVAVAVIVSIIVIQVVIVTNTHLSSHVTSPS